VPQRADVDPFAHIVGRDAIAELTSPQARLQAMLDVEAALAAAQATVGDIPPGAAEAIAEACRAERIDADELLAATELGGIPVIGLVEQLRDIVGGENATFVHRGSTSQDIFDTATMLITAGAASLTIESLGNVATLVDALGRDYGAAPMIARTLTQFALPTTFANVTGRWYSGLDEAIGALQATAGSLPVQLGGPVGDTSTYGPHAAEVTKRVAERLGLVVPKYPWSTMRTPIARIAGAWGVAATAVGDIATQVVALTISDVGELAERAPGAGGSSSMAHKQNPVAAIRARAAALQVPGLVATLLHAAGSQDFERASGPWHAEWPALNALFSATASAADWLRLSLERIEVDTRRMAANLETANKERTT
jgi:3-carboxy-cis,cis-muconate cycloisomerase